jgi:hypothetical protein
MPQRRAGKNHDRRGYYPIRVRNHEVIKTVRVFATDVCTVEELDVDQVRYRLGKEIEWPLNTISIGILLAESGLNPSVAFSHWKQIFIVS